MRIQDLIRDLDKTYALLDQLDPKDIQHVKPETRRKLIALLKRAPEYIEWLEKRKEEP